MTSPRKPWGTFEVDDAGGVLLAVHVAPVAEDGTLWPGHILDEVCLCEPEVMQEPGCLPVILHKRDQ